MKNRKTRVLLLEDQPNWQEIITDAIDTNTYDIIIASTLKEAISLLHKQVIDVAIVDIRLSEGDVDNNDGMIFLDELEKFYLEDRSHALMLSGHATEKHVIGSSFKRDYSIVTDFFLKDEIDDDALISGIATAARHTEAARSEQNRIKIRADSSMRFNNSINSLSIVKSLFEEDVTKSTSDDFNVILRNLLINYLPLGEGIGISVENFNKTDKILHLICWSREFNQPIELLISKRNLIEDISFIHSFWEKKLEPDWVPYTSVQFDGWSSSIREISYEKYLEIISK